MNAVAALLNAVMAPLAEAGGSFWFPPEGSSFAKTSDSLFYYVLVFSVFFFVIIIAVTLMCLMKYNRKANKKADVTFTHSNFLEVTWTVIPGLLLIPMFWYGFTGFVDVYTPPKDCYQITVTGRQWNWIFSYPNGANSGELHVPLGVPVQVTMQSEDVIHSLFIPAFRVKRDAVPGRYNTAWFMATRTGKFQIYCAEYCGTSHSTMRADCFVQEPQEFEQWVKDASDIDKLLKGQPPAAKGEYLYKTRGCSQCHSTDGKRGTGPSFKGIWGEPALLADGSTVIVDANYIHESVMVPLAKVVKGFDPVMPSFRGKLSDKEIGYLKDYIQSLKK